MRTAKAVRAAELEFSNRVWYARSAYLRDHRADDDITEDVTAIAKRRFFENLYGADTLGPLSEFQWGMICGKLSALRWVMGSDWDDIDRYDG
jgi:hypothetical protein